MSGKKAEEGIVTRQIKQRRRNQEWYDFLTEKRNALTHHLRASVALNSRRGYDNDNDNDDIDMREALDFAEVGDAAGGGGGGGRGRGLTDIDTGQWDPPETKIALPAASRSRSVPSLPVLPLKPLASAPEYDGPHDYAAHHPGSQASMQVDAEDAGFVHGSCYRPGVPGDSTDDIVLHLSAPPAYEFKAQEKIYPPAERPPLQRAEPSGGFGYVDARPPSRYIKGPEGAIFSIPVSLHPTGAVVPQPYEQYGEQPVPQGRPPALRRSDRDGMRGNSGAAAEVGLLRQQDSIAAGRDSGRSPSGEYRRGEGGKSLEWATGREEAPEASDPSPPASPYLFDGDNWALGYDYPGAASFRKE